MKLYKCKFYKSYRPYIITGFPNRSTSWLRNQRCQTRETRYLNRSREKPGDIRRNFFCLLR